MKITLIPPTRWEAVFFWYHGVPNYSYVDAFKKKAITIDSENIHKCTKSTLFGHDRFYISFEEGGIIWGALVNKLPEEIVFARVNASIYLFEGLPPSKEWFYFFFKLRSLSFTFALIIAATTLIAAKLGKSTPIFNFVFSEPFLPLASLLYGPFHYFVFSKKIKYNYFRIILRGELFGLSVGALIDLASQLSGESIFDRGFAVNLIFVVTGIIGLDLSFSTIETYRRRLK